MSTIIFVPQCANPCHPFSTSSIGAGLALAHHVGPFGGGLVNISLTSNLDYYQGGNRKGNNISLALGRATISVANPFWRRDLISIS